MTGHLNRNCTFLVSTALACGAMLASSADAQTFQHPFYGDELAANEFIARRKSIHTEDENHSQHWGYDFTAARKAGNENKWLRFKGATGFTDGSTQSKNSDWYVYGMKVYAMADGTVRRCWRNGRENLRPRKSGDSDSDYLHPDYINDKLHNGGNFLELTLDNGNIMRYSHFQTGTIPQAICPHNAAAFSTSGAASETDVASGARVTTGTYLGKVGNVGQSGNPHLHVHVQTAAGAPVQIRFPNGLATPVNNSKADIDDWKSFAGGRVPPGPTLIWPRRRIGAEYTRHRLPKAEFARLFDHLSDSGYGIQWFDGYQVGGKTFYNMVWRKAPAGGFRFKRGMTASEFGSYHEEKKAEGFEPVHIERYLDGDAPRIAAIYYKGAPGSYYVRGSVTPTEHETILAEQKAAGRNPAAISVTSANGTRRYSVLYRSASIGGWSIKSAIAQNTYQQVFSAMAGEGKGPIYANAYKHGGQTFYSVIFAGSGAGGFFKHDQTAEQIQSWWNSQTGAGKKTRFITGVDGAGTQHRFVAGWK